MTVERGIPYAVRGYPLPRLDRMYTDCVIYIYKSSEDAKNGEHIGGSGFLFSVPLLGVRDESQIYAVTNGHVIKKAGAHPVIRLNTVDGIADSIETEFSDWKGQPSPDLAVCRVNLSANKYRFAHVPQYPFALTEKEFNDYGIGAGDEVFMSGRFVTVAGKQKNEPAIRFGNIASVPSEPIKDEDDNDQESILVECRSVSGYSGSPVFVWIPPAYPRPFLLNRNVSWKDKYRGPIGPWLLGVNWCHIPNYEPVVEIGDDGKKNECNDLQAKSNTAMAGVIPVWRLVELLYSEELVKQREKKVKEILHRRSEAQAVSDFAENEKSTFTHKDFDDALRKATRKVSPAKPTSRSE